MEFPTITSLMKYNILAISDIHFVNEDHKKKYDCSIIYDYFIYAGDIFKDGNDKPMDIGINFFKSIRAKNKIIVLGNNDSKKIYNILYNSLCSTNSTDCKYYIVNKLKIIDDLIWCSAYSQIHEYNGFVSSNKYGQNDSLIPSTKDLIKYPIFVTHGKFDIGSNTLLKNKLFIYGHDHIYQKSNYNHNDQLKYVERTKNHNVYVNVSPSNLSRSLYDRDVYFTHINIINTLINVNLINAYDSDNIIEQETYFKYALQK
jgi:predicted phosphodiesterase